MMKWITLILMILFSSVLFSWNGNGHRVIAQIAYDQLSTAAKIQIDHIIAKQFHAKYPDDRFLEASTWPDELRSKTNEYDTWHYINLPDVYDHVTPPNPDSKNVVWAIQQAENNLQNAQFSSREQVQSLSFLIHFIGDIHQPLHCISRYSNDFQPPSGDRGGNDYFIRSRFSRNLHAYWDDGLGVFYDTSWRKPFGYYKVVWMAKQLEKQYPPSFFGQRLLIDSPKQWSKESFELAKSYAYTVPENLAPSADYIDTGKQIVSEQAALAGYRLAAVLNRIFGENHAALLNAALLTYDVSNH